MGEKERMEPFRFIVGGYGIPAIPTKSVGQLWQSGYGKDAIPSYRLPLIYNKYEHVLIVNFYQTIIYEHSRGIYDNLRSAITKWY